MTLTAGHGGEAEATTLQLHKDPVNPWETGMEKSLPGGSSWQHGAVCWDQLCLPVHTQVFWGSSLFFVHFTGFSVWRFLWLSGWVLGS